MHDVEVAADDVEVLARGQEPLQPRLQRVRPRKRGLVVLGRGRKMHPPAIRRALPVKQVRPFLGVGNVVALGIAVPAEIVGDLDVQGAVGIGETLELDAELLAYDAARSFGADEIGAGEDSVSPAGLVTCASHGRRLA